MRIPLQLLLLGIVALALTAGQASAQQAHVTADGSAEIVEIGTGVFTPVPTPATLQPVQADRIQVTADGSAEIIIETGSGSTVLRGGGNTLFNSGPFITCEDCLDGADGSVLQNNSLNMNSLGFNHSVPTFRVADEFTVPESGWVIEQALVFAYETGSTQESSFTVVNARIWDGQPGEPGSEIVFGDAVENRMIGTDWTGAYRFSEGTPGSTRPIMQQTVALGVELPAGTYWLDWQTSGTVGSGPWAPPITVEGECETGNAVQLTADGWQALVDSGTNECPQGLPFVLIGEAPAADDLLFDNGPVANCPGCLDGADGSVLQSTSLDMNSLGFNHSVPTFRVADDFTIEGESSWLVEQVEFFAYETGSTLESSFLVVNLRIWDGQPGEPGSEIVFGDAVTNRLIETDWSGVYRYSETNVGTTRPIMVNTVEVGTILEPGTYWLDWQSSGTIGSGPWAPPITIDGDCVTGDAYQLTADGWQEVRDSGIEECRQGLPFRIYGTAAPVSNEQGPVADALSLEPAFPNPVTDRASVAFVLPQSGEVTLALYDVMGRRIEVLAEGHFVAGSHSVSIEGSQLANGVYLLHLQAGSQTQSQRLTIIR